MISPSVATRAIRSLPMLAYQSAPSGPAVMPVGSRVELVPCGSRNMVIVPSGVMRPTRWPAWLVNQTLPSGPVVIPRGLLRLGGPLNVAMVPVAGFSRPIRSVEADANQMLPSAPAVTA